MVLLLLAGMTWRPVPLPGWRSVTVTVTVTVTVMIAPNSRYLNAHNHFFIKQPPVFAAAIKRLAK
jgi:hypothetical protein